MKGIYVEKSVFKLAMFLTIIGGLNWLSAAFLKKDLVAYAFESNEYLSKIVYGLVGISALALAFRRDTYLPFLGDTVVPTGLLQESSPSDATWKVTVATNMPNKKILYWASEPDGSKKTPWGAYKSYANSGVAMSNDKGVVEMTVRKPIGYYTPWGKWLKPHIHYRVQKTNGMLGRVETVFV